MQTKSAWGLVRCAPAVTSLIGSAVFSAYTAAVPIPAQSNQSTATTISSSTDSSVDASALMPLKADRLNSATTGATNLSTGLATVIQPSEMADFSAVDLEEKNFGTVELDSHDQIDSAWKTADAVSSGTTQAGTTQAGTTQAGTTQANGNYAAANHSSPAEQPLSDIALDLGNTQSTQLAVSDITEESVLNEPFSTTKMLLPPTALPGLVSFAPEQIAQSEAAPAEAPAAAPAEAKPPSPRWRFTVTPYAFVPLTVDGSATVRDFTADLHVGLNDIFNSLNFAAAGRAEAWRGHLGFIFDGAYFNVGQDVSKSIPIPSCLCGILPSRLNADVTVQYGQFDLGVGYRAAANPYNAATEFELGPIVFDAIVGMRIYAIHQEINISTDVGTERNLEASNTIVEPLVSGRIRWNVSPTLAGWIRGDIAGFGLGGTLLATSFTGGLDWLISGNTSLLLAYRISTLSYTTTIRGEDFGLDLLMQGPYIGVVFRF